MITEEREGKAADRKDFGTSEVTAWLDFPITGLAKLFVESHIFKFG